MSAQPTLRPRLLYRELASLVQARLNCLDDSRNNVEWADKHETRIERLVKEYMPSGSGFDSGTRIDLERSHGGKLVFDTAFHHMDESGGYDGWTEHTVTVTPAFDGVNIRIGGRNRNDVKELIHQEFDSALETDLAYAFEWERLSEKYTAKLVSRWIDDPNDTWIGVGGYRHQTQRWDVVRVTASFDSVVTADCTTWLTARDTAVRIMQEWEARAESTPATPEVNA